jgi:hypothetical protein
MRRAHRETRFRSGLQIGPKLSNAVNAMLEESKHA